MMIRYIALDLDGTLLNDESKLSETTIKTIKKINNYYNLIIISGRHYYEIKEIVNVLCLKSNTIIISCDGQYISTIDNNIIKTFDFLDFLDLKYITNNVKGKRINFYTDTVNYTVINCNCFFSIIKSIIKREHIKYSSVLENKKIYIEKISIEGVKKIDIEKLKIKYNINILKNGRVEILNKKVSKFKALSYLFSGEQLDEILYFGDDNNDYDCFVNMKHCVAMSNSNKSILKIAKTITNSNNEDGVSNYLSNFIKKMVTDNEKD